MRKENTPPSDYRKATVIKEKAWTHLGLDNDISRIKELQKKSPRGQKTSSHTEPSPIGNCRAFSSAINAKDLDSIKDCQYDTKCLRCGGNHQHKDFLKSKEEKIGAYCGGAHNAFYKRCHSFIRLELKKLNLCRLNKPKVMPQLPNLVIST
ncbi:hypothetical protein HOLleu_35792 [Holothuria leucospilota]|uniref:Uncharacterized protein n=1 Tax=Holothuria leucospilota TaxID=206669 RepID=A0A9Q0YL93_HOLLE|nr:hypothetical protein HOLleu_35792 [Holothuria leucospilota]